MAKQYSAVKIPPLGKIHGGKSYLARRLIQLHPPNDSYDKHVECFGGLASVKLNLQPATTTSPRIDVYNDRNERLTHMFRMIRDRPAQMTAALQTTLYSEADFNRAKDSMAYFEANDIEKARLTYILHKMSFGGQGNTFSRSRSRTRRGIADVVSGHLGVVHESLTEIFMVVSRWLIECRWALDCARHHDSPRTMHYMDPPYLPATRAKGSRDAYGPYEMTYEDHEALLEAVPELKGKVMISGYPSALYKKYLDDKGWHRHTFEIANHAAGPGRKKRRMIECAWTNYEVSSGQEETSSRAKGHGDREPAARRKAKGR